MDITTLIKQYFNKQSADQVTIDVFDRTTIDVVYRRVIELLKGHLNIELGVLQALAYCLYEVLDNVIIHMQINTLV